MDMVAGLKRNWRMQQLRLLHTVRHTLRETSTYRHAYTHTDVRMWSYIHSQALTPYSRA